MTSPQLKTPGRITSWLENSHSLVFSLYAVMTAFGTYFCMYAFRKPFGASAYDGLIFFNTTMDLKVALTISQVIGYATSKYLGLKYCSEVTRERRARMLVSLIVCAELALALFAALPEQFKFIAILLNGLSLGMIWGLVVRYLEGRRTSEVLLVGLSCSYIVASGIVKDIGKGLIDSGVATQFTMPVITGALFLAPFFLFTWLLNQLPEPDAIDEADRIKRVPMDATQRRLFVRQFLPGLILIMFVYLFLSAFREIRDMYGINLLEELGLGDTAAVFSKTDMPIAIPVFLSLLLLNSIKGHVIGMIATFAIMVTGTLVLGISTLLFDMGHISPIVWMILIGVGGYLTYVPYGTVIFDRLLASTRFTGTAVFAIYIADSLGYTGSVALQLYKALGQSETTWLNFFRGMAYLLSVVGTVLLSLAAAYFVRKIKAAQATIASETGQIPSAPSSDL
ncbi:MAG: hypothetical protein GY917_18245 [Planctomycetaceae bacterium]|nr:hypothetical protein [Planctomycetaceae bacterium]